MTEAATKTPEEILERGLESHFGRPVRIVEAESEPLDSFSTQPISRLRVTLDDGKRLPVIFKRLEPKPEKHARGEVLTYRRLLSGRRFGAPELYASLRDEERNLYWLFLEDVGEWKLEWCETEVWPSAFRWMARMHAEYHGREKELRSLNCLDEHGSEFYRALAAAARRSLGEKGEPEARVRFDRLMERFLEFSVEYLAHQPRTLVHGDASCHNFIVRPGPEIRPIDWEWAATGPAAWDVMKLLSGWGRKKPKLLAAYLEEFERHAPLDRKGFERALEHCRIMHTLWYLRWWTKPCKDPEFVNRLLDKMESTWLRLEGERVGV
ncbi:MAG: phosphotransferase [Rubrobacteraceae bacterium]